MKKQNVSAVEFAESPDQWQISVHYQNLCAHFGKAAVEQFIQECVLGSSVDLKKKKKAKKEAV